MFIQTEDTPNPQSLKFVLDQTLLADGQPGFDFPSAAAADHAPLAAVLFEIDGVESVFIGSDFVTVTKGESADWPVLKPHILTSLSDHLTAGRPIIVEASAPTPKGPATPLEDYEGEDREVVEQIIELIDTRVRPAVAADGGDIVFQHYEPKTGIVFLSMHGACQGCPSSTMTLKAGIENMLKHYVPEVVSVEPVM
ncbi:MAG: NifU family protein [Pseudomonadota bacterium]